MPDCLSYRYSRCVTALSVILQLQLQKFPGHGSREHQKPNHVEHAWRCRKLGCTGIGIASLFIDYKSGRISAADFYEASCSLSVEAGLSAVGTAFIPVPVLGSVVGAMAARAGRSGERDNP